jgi:hypothetical protein
MDVVGHHDETTGKPAVARWAVQKKCHKAGEHCLVVENADAAIHTWSQQVRDVAFAVWPDTVESAQTVWRVLGRSNIAEGAG